MTGTGISMAILRGLWKVLRGVGLLALLAGLIAAVLMASCLAKLFSGDRSTHDADKLRFGA